MGHHVSHAFSACINEFVKFPDSKGSAMPSNGFYNQVSFPNVMGCTHVQIKAPVENEIEFVNRVTTRSTVS